MEVNLVQKTNLQLPKRPFVVLAEVTCSCWKDIWSCTDGNLQLEKSNFSWWKLTTWSHKCWLLLHTIQATFAPNVEAKRGAEMIRTCKCWRRVLADQSKSLIASFGCQSTPRDKLSLNDFFWLGVDGKIDTSSLHTYKKRKMTFLGRDGDRNLFRHLARLLTSFFSKL